MNCSIYDLNGQVYILQNNLIRFIDPKNCQNIRTKHYQISQ